VKWQKINPYCLKSGPWRIAKHGGPSPKYLLTHDAKPGMLCWFESAQAAMDLATALESTPDAPARSS
jgi:homospermidine synthase